MTSSLVGSEMCIRDRPPLMPMAPSGSDLTRNAVPLHGHPTCCEAAVTVSYTHLTLPTICSV
eukprot:6789076-Prorocentrum_lima.AAC.1